MSLIKEKGGWNKVLRSNIESSEYHIGDEVYFAVDETHKIAKGTIVEIQTDDGIDNERRGKHVHYTIEDYKLHERFKVSCGNVSGTLDQLLALKGLKQFDCEVFLNRCSSISRTVIAATLEDAISSLEKEYPDAYSIREIDPWR